MITHKSNPGPDMVPSIFFINCKFVLTVPLLHLFNLSLSTGFSSRLAGLLILLFINDINFSNSRKFLFADDLKFFRIVNSSYDASLLQIDLNILSDWCTVNKLLLNIEKCKCITFSRSRVPLPHSYHINKSPLASVHVRI